MFKISSIFVIEINTNYGIFMSENKYTYYFPKNKEIKEQLNKEDILLIANATGYKEKTVRAMLNGHRRLTYGVRQKCMEFIKINKMKRSLLK